MTDLQTMPTVSAGVLPPKDEPLASDGPSPPVEAVSDLPGPPSLVFRVIGIASALGLLVAALQLMGGHLTDYMQVTAMLIIVAVSVFGLMASHGPYMLGRLIAVVLGSHSNDEAEANYLRGMCRRGRQLAYSSGVLSMLFGIIHVLSVLDQPGLIGPGLAVAIVGLALAALVAELGFGAAAHWVRTESV